MSAANKSLGAAAIIMAVCCAVLPLLGGLVAGGLAAKAGTIGVVLAAVIVTVAVAFSVRRHRRGC